jgi:hypothetical protein
MMRDGIADAPGGRGNGVVAQDVAEIYAASLPARAAATGRSLPVIQ